MDTVTTLATIPAVLALTNVFKAFGIEGKWATLTAIILGVGVVAGGTYVDPGVWQTVTEGLILGLGAAGVYDVASTSAPADVRSGDIESASIVIQPE